MLFNSLQFLFFFVIITILYWQLPNRFRWLMLLFASCYFYMAFVPIYILILGFTIVIDYFAGLFLEKIDDKRKKKVFLIISIVANVGVLAVFKYYNFFNQNFDRLVGQFSFQTPFPNLNILLPIGLSFHTFQAMSYTIEVYRGNQKAEKNFGIYALYVMFYPQLVAGPIERPQNMLLQFHADHKYNYENLKSGLMQMAFGFFKKVVIADRLGSYVDFIYDDPGERSGSSVLIACIFYSFQIYCDFSGYSDIGIGAARTMGYKLMDNFRMPYLSQSINEFWTRWHISLSSWFRDYVYIPMGGNRVSTQRWYMNLMIVFLLSGLWHGAKWTFIIWGALHGSYLIFGLALQKMPGITRTGYSPFFKPFRILLTFTLVTIAWIFFRAPGWGTARLMFSRISSIDLSDSIQVVTSYSEIVFSFILIFTLLVKEYWYPIIPTKNSWVFYGMLTSLALLCYLFGVFSNNQFIYFQF
jgi:alginate O-acetyltransferase complex protein AlgI